MVIKDKSLSFIKVDIVYVFLSVSFILFGTFVSDRGFIYFLFGRYCFLFVSLGS